jgi:hypothetical protein
MAAPSGGTCQTANARLANESTGFHYVYPQDSGGGGGRLAGIAAADSFEAYDSAIQTRVASKLPPELANHRVTIAFRELLTTASAEAQLNAQIADGTLESVNAAGATKIATERASIQKHKSAPNLKHSELKDFAHKLFDLQLKHNPADFTTASPNLQALAAGSSASTTSRPKLDAALVGYLKAYYDGKFYDRMGTAVTKPQLPTSLTNFSIPDSEIVAAETVLLEFLVDSIDATPVMGNNDGHPDGTTYYPGASTNEPTALAVGLASYVVLPADGCGITQKNVWVLKDLANGASDQAAAVGGLIVNTPGGISFGLGVLGKISIGDNQTLSDLVKTAASDLALRATLTTSYFALRHVTFTPIEP